MNLHIKGFKGEIYTDKKWKVLYATDASAYKEEPLAVTFPVDKEDIKKLIRFAHNNNTFLIPRTAGTSLAGQVVGNGIVVDVSKHFNRIVEFNVNEKWVIVEPGVVLDELNMFTSKNGLFFGPETSTSNRCMIGGMVGNNACGAHSLIYGSTRDHLLEVEAILSDGTEAVFHAMDKELFVKKCNQEGTEGEIYRKTRVLLRNPEVLDEIKKEYPDERLKRRNTGYALDIITNNEVFDPNISNKFNFCNLLAGSEGTLAFITRIKLALVPLPPPIRGLVCVHFISLAQALEANLMALSFNPGAIELIDEVILQCTHSQIEQRKNRFFVKGNPAAILIIEFARDTKDEIIQLKEKLENELMAKGLGYHFPLLFGEDINKVWSLRKAGLGLLSNIPGDAKPVSVIEDTAVHPTHLPAYIDDIKTMLGLLGLECVNHAHIATGELHLRPVINLKTTEGVELFYKVAEETAHLVKKYRGSLSGEHGDGRLRGQFIPVILGEKNYQVIKEVKQIWDPHHVFNRGKITDTPPMNENLRYIPGMQTPGYDTAFDFSNEGGIVRMAEKCNGSGDCRKSELIGGTMCPSYMATRDEDKTTRARANMLREILSRTLQKNPFNDKGLFEILDLCLSCKGCKNECPSNVDMAKLKSEFLYQYYKANPIPLRSLAIAYFSKLNAIGSLLPKWYNALVTAPLTANIIKKIIGFAAQRKIPLLYKTTLKKWLKKNLSALNSRLPSNAKGVYFFIDEFSNFNDTGTAIKAVELLHALGYRIFYKDNPESGRTYISKGLLRKAKKLAMQNVLLYSEIVNDNMPLIGIEPSAILTFRDEYPDLLRGAMKDKSLQLAKNTLALDEFIANEFHSGNIQPEMFTDEAKKILFHGHCQQKAIASTRHTLEMLSIPVNYTVKEIKSGCCGMAGSFGYEKEHYSLSMKIGELVLFPQVRQAKNEVIIAAPGTSCRQHIADGTGKNALHPVEILWSALKKNQPAS